MDMIEEEKKRSCGGRQKPSTMPRARPDVKRGHALGKTWRQGLGKKRKKQGNNSKEEGKTTGRLKTTIL